MKNRHALTFLGLAAIAAAGAHAQTNTAPSSVTLYGVLDTNLRYTTHENARGNRLIQLDTGGPITGSRWGLRVREDLGGGLSAFTTLESGFDPGTGTFLQGGRVFGRQAFVGLQGGLGQITAGRQYTIAHEMASSYESMYIANNGLLGFQSGYTNLRQDNLLRYAGTFGPVTVLAGWTFGEQPDSVKKGSTEGLAAAYTAGPLRIGGAAQRTYNVTTYVGTTVPLSQQTFYSLGGTYDFSGTKLYLSFNHHKLDNADYLNKALTVGVNAPITPQLTFIGTAMYDRLNRTNASGKRAAAGGVLEYAFSKSTSVYGEVDYTKLGGAWMTVATSPGFSTPFFANYNTRLGLGAGMRMRF
jgi:predicted porin